MRVTPDCDTVNSFPICNRADAQFGPAIVWNGENYIVVWSDRRFSGAYWWLTAARVSRDGSVLDSGYVVGDRDSTNDFYADLGFDGNRCLAVWYHSYYQPWGIFGRFVNAQAQGEDSVFKIASTRTHLYNFPKLEFGDSAYLVAWADCREGAEDFDIFSRLVAPDGHLLGAEQLLATGETDQQRPDVSWDGHDYLVVWTESGLVMGRRVGSDGVPLAPASVLSDSNGNGRTCARVTSGGNNRLVVFGEQRGPETDIYGTLQARPGIEEEGRTPQAASLTLGTVFVSSPLMGEGWGEGGLGAAIYDREGRRVNAPSLGAGVFFIVVKDRVVHKVVSIE